MYGNAVKASWRASLWKILATNASDKKAWCLCLAANRFLDRKEALRRGFSNVIGVDLDREVVQHNTAHGRTVLSLPLSKAVSEWDRPIAVINADYTCGIGNPELPGLIEAWIANPCADGSLLALTVSKGREVGAMMDYIRWMAWNLETVPARVLRPSAGVCGWMTNLIIQHAHIRMGRKLEFDETVECFEYAQSILSACFVDRAAYRAHRQVMETGVYRHPSCFAEAQPLIEAVRALRQRDPSAKRHIAAKMAWHTMRGAA